MRWKFLVATLNLAWHVTLHLGRRLFFIQSAGLQQFLEFYRPDRIVAFTPEEKILLNEFARCISCGLCDAVCPATEGDRPGPSLLPHLSRSVPDFAGITGPDLSACEGCCACETICPERVPIKRIVEFMKTKREEVLPFVPGPGSLVLKSLLRQY